MDHRSEPASAAAPAGGAAPDRPSRFARFARSRYAVPIMCALSFADACVSPIIPEVLLVPLVLSRPQRRWRYTALVSLASVLGGAVGYLLGMLAWDAGLDRLFFDWVPGFTAERFHAVSREFGDQTFWVIFTAGFTPLPFKLFTVTAGVFHADVGFPTFLAAAALSRTLRFALTVWLLHRFGRRVLERCGRTFTAVMVVLFVAAVLALVVRDLSGS